MNKSIKVEPKKRGRPATGKDPLLTTRAPADIIEAVEAWAARTGVTKSEAIRRLVGIGLQASAPAKKSSAGQRSRAAELAGDHIDQLIGKAHPEAEGRKRRLTEGPSDFREQRVDWAKKK